MVLLNRWIQVVKRRQFRLATVLHFYEVQKQRAEFELLKASRVLRDTDAEIKQLEEEIVAVSVAVQDEQTLSLSTTGWLACYRKADFLGKRLTITRHRRLREAEFVAKLEQVRRRWAVAEETLRFLQHDVVTFNHTQADKAQQETLDETVLRQWLSKNSETHSDS